MNNAKVKEIIKFSFYKNIQNKWFILFNIITLVSIVIMLNWSAITSIFKTESEADSFKIAVLDNTNLVYENFVKELSNLENLSNSENPKNSYDSTNLENTQSSEEFDNSSNIENMNTYESSNFSEVLATSEINTKFEIEKITENTYTAENIPDDFAIVEIIPDETEGFKISIISKEGISTTIYNPIKDTLYNLRNDMLAQKYGLENTDLEVLQSDLSINRVMLAVDAEDSNIKELIKLFSSALTYILTILIFSKMANEIAQEKQSKSSEYILTTVSAKEYLFAKIFSNIAILLIQGLLLFVYYFIAIGILNIINIVTTDITLSSGIMSSTISLDTVLYILALLGYSILNLILLCIVQATLSAKTSSTSEAGNTVSLLVFIMMAAYIATVYIITPYTKVSVLLYAISCLPVLSAYFVPAMMIIGQATTLQIIVSLALLILSIPLTFNFCAKIFKNGILDYTKVRKKKYKNTAKEVNKETELNNFLTKRKMKNVGFVVGTAILIYIGSQTVLSLLGNFILPPLLDDFLTETDITLILQILLQVISLGLSSAFVFAYCNYDKKKLSNSTDNSTNKLSTDNIENNKATAKKITGLEKFKIITITLLIVFGLQVLLSGILYPKLGLDYNVTDMFDTSTESNIVSKIILVIALALTPAIFEELFFRKSLIDFTLPYGKYFALLFSSLLFGIIHMNLSQGLFAFIIGLVFGTIYLYTKDIKLSMLIHFINNGFAALAMILPEVGLILVSLLLLLVLLTGFIFSIITLVKKSSRNKIKNFFTAKVELGALKYKYKYIFADYIFDISMILVLVMSILTENMLR